MRATGGLRFAGGVSSVHSARIRVANQTVQLIVREKEALGHMAALMARDYDTVRHSMNVSVFATVSCTG